MSEELRAIRQSLDRIEKSANKGPGVTVLVALITGAFALGGVMLQSTLSFQREQQKAVAKLFGDSTARFYLNSAGLIAEIDTLFEERCTFETFEKDAQLNDKLLALFQLVQSAPPAADQTATRLLDEYNEFIAQAIVRIGEEGADKGAICRESTERRDLLRGQLKEATERLARD